MKALQFNTLAQIASKNYLGAKNSQPKLKAADFELDKFVRSQYLKQENIEVTYKIKGDSNLKFNYIAKSLKNFGGGAVNLPYMSNKVILSTKIRSGLYTNTWVALQNRTTYKPTLLVNGIRHKPVEVNGSYLKYQFQAQKPDVNNNPDNEITIKAGLNPFAYASSIVGIWFE